MWKPAAHLHTALIGAAAGLVAIAAALWCALDPGPLHRIVVTSSARSGAQPYALYDAARADMRRLDGPRTRTLDTLSDVRFIELDARGAMCGECVWTMRIAAGGATQLRTDQPFARRHALDHVALLPWRAVVAALQHAGFGDLDARYASGVTDSSGVTFRFETANATYAVEAPDYGTWPHVLRVSYLEFMELVHAATWSPPLDPRSIPEPSAMRRWSQGG